MSHLHFRTWLSDCHLSVDRSNSLDCKGLLKPALIPSLLCFWTLWLPAPLLFFRIQGSFLSLGCPRPIAVSLCPTTGAELATRMAIHFRSVLLLSTRLFPLGPLFPLSPFYSRSLATALSSSRTSAGSLLPSEYGILTFQVHFQSCLNIPFQTLPCYFLVQISHSRDIGERKVWGL